jgi:hypothetical protein
MVQSNYTLRSARIRLVPQFDNQEFVMHTALKGLVGSGIFVGLAATMAIAGNTPATPKQDKYTVKVPGGLAFSEFKGYESWQVISVSQNPKAMAVILGNPAMVKAFEAGIPDNGKPVPDGAKMAKMHYSTKQQASFPEATVPAQQRDVDFMVKDSKRFADSGGWGYAVFKYDAASDTYKPGTTADQPPQANDAKCGFACHTVNKARDYVFTEYQHR